MERADQQGNESTRGTWVIDPAHTVIEFSVRHMMIATVRGNFGKVEGTIRLDDDDPSASSVDARIETASIDTRQKDRDEHLRSADFFDVERFPMMEFRSRRVEALGSDRYRVTGDLTIRDQTREIELSVTEHGRIRDPWGAERVALSAETSIDRTDFGLRWNQALEAGGVVVGDEVRISLEIQAVAESSGGEAAAERTIEGEEGSGEAA